MSRRSGFKWTDDQIKFVLTQPKELSAAKISILHNAAFRNHVQMDAEQFKYVRHHYRNDPRFQPTESATGNETASGTASGIVNQPSGPMHTPHDGGRTPTQTYPPSNHSQQLGQDRNQSLDSNESGCNGGPGGDCRITGEHRHDNDGSVTFPSVAELTITVGRAVGQDRYNPGDTILTHGLPETGYNNFRCPDVDCRIEGDHVHHYGGEVTIRSVADVQLMLNRAVLRDRENRAFARHPGPNQHPEFRQQPLPYQQRSPNRLPDAFQAQPNPNPYQTFYQHLPNRPQHGGRSGQLPFRTQQPLSQHDDDQTDLSSRIRNASEEDALCDPFDKDDAL